MLFKDIARKKEKIESKKKRVPKCFKLAPNVGLECPNIEHIAYIFNFKARTE